VAPISRPIEALEQFNRDTRLLMTDQAWRRANPLGLLLLAITTSPRGTTWRSALENRPYPIAGRGRVRVRVHATAPAQQHTNQQHTPDPHDFTPFGGVPGTRSWPRPERCIGSLSVQ
jgi:hypothetical protein